MDYSKKFKRSEHLAKRVINILVLDYIRRKNDKSAFWMDDYIRLIKWCVEDYENCGYDMDEFKKPVNLLEKRLNDIKNEN